jgi:hypothetical protein
MALPIHSAPRTNVSILFYISLTRATADAISPVGFGNHCGDYYGINSCAVTHVQRRSAMQVSAEIRWFWRNCLPVGLDTWFCGDEQHGCRAGGGKSRVDEYLLDPNQRELGLKYRANKPGVEVKGLVGITTHGLAAKPFVGPIELWTKWTSQPLSLASTIPIEKRRWLRKFDAESSPPVEIELDDAERPLAKARLPDVGCNVELTQISVPDHGVWWTLGFEAFGAIFSVEEHLRAVAAQLAAREPPAFMDGLLSGYPGWLSDLFRANKE